jgi:predicted ATPase
MSDGPLNDRPAVRIEPENEWAWCGERRLDLTPKAFAILRHFVEHPERLVTKEDLFAAVWGDTVVSESALTSCIRDIRRALEDQSRTPRYIETVHRRGFRFIGPIATSRPAAAIRLPDAPTLVGRDAELARLRTLFEIASGGRRQLVFVTGEAGIGKTTLVEAFLAALPTGDELRIGRGQCVEQYGAGEAYLPVLEAIARLAREPRGDALVHILRQHAPTWLVELPALLADEDLEAVQQRTQGATRDRMLRELIEALDVVSAQVPLVLVLEDLHWSDSATVDLLAMLARRRDPARMLILATYRPADVAASAHPLKAVKHELHLHGQCEELALDFLSAAAVEHLLSGRFPSASFAPDLAPFLHRNTSGNPLFLVNVIDHLIARGHVHEVDDRWTLSVPVADIAPDVPDTLWQLVDKQIERLTPEEQAILAVASVAGAEFSAALASVDGIDARTAEESCAALARRGQFLRATGSVEWPDGTVAGRYAFIHAVYRNVLYDRVSIGHRVGLHLRIGARLEDAHGRRAAEIAGELAMHFEEGRDFERALQYRKDAADNALRHHAYREADGHATRALELLHAFPESPERAQRELAIQMILGAAFIAKGWASPEVARTYARAHELCNRAGLTPELFPIVGGLFGFYVTRAELRVARTLSDQLTTLAETTTDSALLLGAHNAAGMVSFYEGDFVTALAAMERGMAVYDPREHNPNRLPAFWGGHDTGVSCAVHAAWCLWLLGHPARAAARMRDALVWARAAEHPFTLTFACHFAASFHEARRDVEAVRAFADEADAHSTEHGFELFASLAAVHRGWLRGDAAEIRSGVAAYRNTGSGLGVPTYLGLAAEAYERSDQRDEGLVVVADALALSDEGGAHYWDAELVRLQGALLLRRGAAGRRASASAQHDAEACFRRAIEIAQKQKANTLALRATTSLARLRQSQAKVAEAQALLSEAYARFTEGFDSADLAEAKALLEQLEAARGKVAHKRR